MGECRVGILHVVTVVEIEHFAMLTVEVVILGESSGEQFCVQGCEALRTFVSATFMCATLCGSGKGRGGTREGGREEGGKRRRREGKEGGGREGGKEGGRKGGRKREGGREERQQRKIKMINGFSNVILPPTNSPGPPHMYMYLP